LAIDKGQRIHYYYRNAGPYGDDVLSQKAVVIDLYSGVGGLSLGAARAGFCVQSAVELDVIASETHALNFPKARHLRFDLAKASGLKLLEASGVTGPEVDGLVGGPPCQGFSDIGHKAANDPRNDLLKHFFRLVSEIGPRFFLAENVPGVLAQRNAGILKEALRYIPERYTILPTFTVTASHFGAPTERTRVFFIGFDSERMNEVESADFLAPAGMEDARVSDALVGLPKIRSSWQKKEQSWRSVAELPDSFYGGRISGCIPADVGDPESLKLYAKSRIASGFLGTNHLPETVARFASLKPGEFDPVSKGRRLDPEGYCPTLRAGTGSDRGSFQAVRPIHPRSPRVIAPREAARLQGFPDWFQFHPTKWHSFRQIGNSVSPFVAEALLRKLFLAL
jgi:DNA (cytosine-5)-methyltransferase 1